MSAFTSLIIILCLTSSQQLTEAKRWNQRKSTALSVYSPHRQRCPYCPTHQDGLLSRRSSRGGTCDYLHPACVPDQCLAITPPWLMISAVESSSYTMCWYCENYCPSCMEQYCYGGEKVARRFNMCAYCHQYYKPCVPLYCTSRFIVKRPILAFRSVGSRSIFPTIEGMCSWCKKLKPPCIPLYCLGGRSPRKFSLRKRYRKASRSRFAFMCFWCRKYYLPCTNLYCVGGNALLTRNTSLTPSQARLLVCTYCVRHDPYYVPNFCPNF